jgi:uncharacterized protein YprB with RNaseH-like and TPR domain
MKTYLDIETSFSGEITVIGMYRPSCGIVQLVGNNVRAEHILEFIDGSYAVCTYNGSRFDLPVIKNLLGIDLASTLRSHDLMFDCWSRNLYGGLKAVEKKLGIARNLPDVNGYDALLLWQQYVRYGDEQSLQKLLEYNKEDVLNLPVLEEKLHNLPPG